MAKRDYKNIVPGGTVTSDYGFRKYTDYKGSNFHPGIDIGGVPRGAPVYASYDGKVIISGSSSTAGNWVVLEHDMPDGTILYSQ